MELSIAVAVAVLVLSLLYWLRPRRKPACEPALKTASQLKTGFAESKLPCVEKRTSATSAGTHHVALTKPAHYCTCTRMQTWSVR